MLIEQRKKIEQLADAFLEQARDKPWIFQKCSLRGLNIARNCLSNIREDSQVLLQNEMRYEMDKLSRQLGEIRDFAKKNLKH